MDDAPVAVEGDDDDGEGRQVDGEAGWRLHRNDPSLEKITELPKAADHLTININDTCALYRVRLKGVYYVPCISPRQEESHATY